MRNQSSSRIPGTFGRPDRQVHMWTVIKQGTQRGRDKEQKAVWGHLYDWASGRRLLFPRAVGAGPLQGPEGALSPVPHGTPGVY